MAASINPESNVHESVYVAQGAAIVGDVTVGPECGVWYNAVIRGDEAPIRIGSRTNVQDNAVLHVDPGQPLEIGDDVTVGHGAILHACTVGDGTLIGMGAIVLSRAKIGRGCIIGAGALVAQGKKIPDGSLAFGSPAKVIRPLTPEEIEANLESAKTYVQHAKNAKGRHHSI